MYTRYEVSVQREARCCFITLVARMCRAACEKTALLFLDSRSFVPAARKTPRNRGASCLFLHPRLQLAALEHIAEARI